MINNALNNLFDDIYNSSEYKEYKKIKSILQKDKNISLLVDDIKSMQKKATYLEYNNDMEYKSVDKDIRNKLHRLNNNVIYKEYLNKLKDLEELLDTSKNIIEGYLNDL